MKDNTQKKYFSIDYEEGPFNTKKIVIGTHIGKEMGLSESADSLWKTSSVTSYARASLSHMPLKSQIIDSTRKVFGYYEKHKDPLILAEWKEAADTLKTLPRIIIIPEDESSVNKDRRKSGNKYIWALPNFHDIRMREVLKGLEFRWNSNKGCYEFYGSPDDAVIVTRILSKWNGQNETIKFNKDIIYKFFKLYKNEQEESIRWLMSQWEKGNHGALDADDMGIGKTLTALAVGLAAKEHGYINKIIVVANLSNVKTSWINDAWKGLLDSPCQAFSFTSDVVKKAKYKDESVLRDEMDESVLIVTNYEHLKNCGNLKILSEYASDALVVFDEATKCSNPSTDNFKSAFKISMLSKFSIGLTGTPLSKNIYEAWSIFRLLDPALYPTGEFYENHVREKVQTIWIPKFKKSKEIKIPEYVNSDMFLNRVKPYFIRHEKNIEPSQAVKDERRYLIEPMSCGVELTLAENIRSGVKKIYKKDIIWDKLGDDKVRVPRWQISALNYIQAALDDPYILYMSEKYKNFDSDVKEYMNSFNVSRNTAVEAVFKYTEPPAPGTLMSDVLKYDREQQVTLSLLESLAESELKDYIPAKSRVLIELIETNWNNSSIVVFSTYSRICERLHELLKEYFPEKYVNVINGSLNSKQRETVTEEFKNAGSGILICTDAMAYGANLQFAKALVHYNLPWQSSVWKQRTDRIFRTGASGIKDIVYLTVDHPLEDRKLEILGENVDVVKKGMGIELSEMPDAEYISTNNFIPTRRSLLKRIELSPVFNEEAAEELSIYH